MLSVSTQYTTVKIAQTSETKGGQIKWVPISDDGVVLPPSRTEKRRLFAAKGFSVTWAVSRPARSSHPAASRSGIVIDRAAVSVAGAIGMTFVPAMGTNQRLVTLPHYLRYRPPAPKTQHTHTHTPVPSPPFPTSTTTRNILSICNSFSHPFCILLERTHVRARAHTHTHKHTHQDPREPPHAHTRGHSSGLAKFSDTS